ncbi:hypothetical protein WJX77_004951 [Trebouxia sp. C0004]
MKASYIPPFRIVNQEQLIRTFSSWNHHATPGSAWRLYTHDDLANSPSRQDGVSAELEQRYKGLMVTLIWRVGEMLNSPMVTVSAAAILLQRFFGRRSLVHNDKLVVATACLFLAGKVEDTPRSLHRISEHMYEAFCKDFSRVSAATAKARWEDMAYQENFKAAVLAAERSLLFTLGFNFRIDTPHKCLLHELQGVAKSLKAPIEQACASAAAADLQPSHVQQAAYDVCNESLRCDVVMTHTPLEIAIASMYFSLKYHNISHLMPGGMQWYSQWSVTEDRIKGVVHAQLQMYIECASHVFPTATPVQISAPATAAASPLPDAAGTPQAVVPAATQQQWLNAKAALSQQHVKPEQSAMPPSQSSQYAAQPVRAPPRVPSQSNIFMPTAPTVQRGLDHQIRNDRRSADKGQMPAPKFVPPSVGVKRPKPDSPSTVAAPVHTHKLVETDMF